MWLSIKRLAGFEREICLKTISANAVFAIVGDAIAAKKSISIVRMGDGEYRALKSDRTQSFGFVGSNCPEWNARLGVEGMPTGLMQDNLLKAGNECTYFAPSVSGISFEHFNLYEFFDPRPFYFDNFFVEIWTAQMIKILLEASDGVFIMHREYEKIIENFRKNYEFDNGKEMRFGGFPKNNWDDNEQAIEAAVNSDMQLILFSAGPGGKAIAPEIAKAENKIVIDAGNSLIHWSNKFMLWSVKE